MQSFSRLLNIPHMSANLRPEGLEMVDVADIGQCAIAGTRYGDLQQDYTVSPFELLVAGV